MLLTYSFLLLQIDVTIVVHIVQQTRIRLKVRYLKSDPMHVLSGGEYVALPKFIKNHQKMDKREMRAEGIDAEGHLVSFSVNLHELPLKGQDTDGDITACYELSLEFVRRVDKEMEWRMRDLDNLEGPKLFRTASYIPDDAKRVEACNR
ncbi:unnamed protein product [Closterium sp. NIES-54]